MDQKSFVSFVRLQEIHDHTVSSSSPKPHECCQIQLVYIILRFANFQSLMVMEFGSGTRDYRD